MLLTAAAAGEREQQAQNTVKRQTTLKEISAYTMFGGGVFYNEKRPTQKH